MPYPTSVPNVLKAICEDVFGDELIMYYEDGCLIIAKGNEVLAKWCDIKNLFSTLDGHETVNTALKPGHSLWLYNNDGDNCVDENWTGGDVTGRTSEELLDKIYAKSIFLYITYPVADAAGTKIDDSINTVELTVSNFYLDINTTNPNTNPNKTIPTDYNVNIPDADILIRGADILIPDANNIGNIPNTNANNTNISYSNGSNIIEFNDDNTVDAIIPNSTEPVEEPVYMSDEIVLPLYTFYALMTNPGNSDVTKMTNYCIVKNTTPNNINVSALILYSGSEKSTHSTC